MGCGASKHVAQLQACVPVVPEPGPAAARKAATDTAVAPPTCVVRALEARFHDLMAARRAARLGHGPASAYELAGVLQQTPMVAPMRVIPFAALRAASRAGRVSALADAPDGDGATVDVTELPKHARAKIILVSHRWWSSVNAQPDRVEHGWVRMRAALHAAAMLYLWHEIVLGPH